MNGYLKQIRILGGGQLALMLAEAADSLGVSTAVLPNSARDPAAAKYSRGLLGGVDDVKSLSDFMRLSGPILFESDFLPYDKLYSFLGAEFMPALNTMERLSDKLEQKKVLKAAGMRVADFEEMKSEESADAFLGRVGGRFGESYVLKWARGGYDGKGVWISTPGESQRAIDFIENAQAQNTRVFAEEKIGFSRELAQVAVFSRSKDFRAYPLVVSRQRNGICDYAFGPASHFGVNEVVQNQIKLSLEGLARSLDLFGCFAVEMFELSDGSILANEIAPRVHNSGHFTLSCSLTSQFENHIRATLGFELGSTETQEFFLMKNILGTCERQIPQAPQTPEPSWDLKWYGKAQMRVGRKMGHINYVNDRPFDVMEIEAKMSAWIDAFPKSQ
jgi:5-(carboxyamino)imidazole ribonucleotide synthase